MNISLLRIKIMSMLIVVYSYIFIKKKKKFLLDRFIFISLLNKILCFALQDCFRNFAPKCVMICGSSFLYINGQSATCTRMLRIPLVNLNLIE